MAHQTPYNTRGGLAEVSAMPHDEVMEASGSEMSFASPMRSESKHADEAAANPNDGSALSAKEGPSEDKDGEMAIANDAFDEAVELSESDDSFDTIDDGLSPAPVKVAPRLEAKEAGPGAKDLGGASLGNSQAGAPSPRQPLGGGGARLQTPLASPGGVGGGTSVGSSRDSSNDDDDESGDEDNEADGSKAGGATQWSKVQGAYDASEYEHLRVGRDVSDLFDYITRFKPHEVELEPHIKCFVPEYIPAIGEMDAFVKVKRPDGLDSGLGLKILDEPCARQSDGHVLELQLRALSKKQHGEASVRAIDNAADNPALVGSWIDSITALHDSKPPAQVMYRKLYPDIDVLMEEWPQAVEDALGEVELPGPDVDLDLQEYAKLVCVALDIPFHPEHPAEALHVLFTLYATYRDNPHFGANDNAKAGGGRGGSGGDFLMMPSEAGLSVSPGPATPKY